MTFTGCRRRRIRTPWAADSVVVAPGELVVSQMGVCTLYSVHCTSSSRSICLAILPPTHPVLASEVNRTHTYIAKQRSSVVLCVAEPRLISTKIMYNCRV